MNVRESLLFGTAKVAREVCKKRGLDLDPEKLTAAISEAAKTAYRRVDEASPALVDASVNVSLLQDYLRIECMIAGLTAVRVAGGK